MGTTRPRPSPEEPAPNGKFETPPWARGRESGPPGAYRGYVDPRHIRNKALAPGEELKERYTFKGSREVPVDVRAHIWNYDNKEFDVSSDVIGVAIQRNSDAPSRCSITIANEGDKYRSLFQPMDRVRIWGRRDDWERPVFTGYIRRNPLFNLISQREITLECEDVIGLLTQKEWDPNLPENINAVSSYLPASQVERFDGVGGNGPTGTDPNAGNPDASNPDSGGSPEGGSENAEESRLLFREAEDDEEDGSEEDGPEEDGPEGDGEGTQDAVTPDQTLAFILLAPEHLNLDPSMVWIEAFPEGWKERAAKIDAQSLQPTYKGLKPSRGGR